MDTLVGLPRTLAVTLLMLLSLAVATYAAFFTVCSVETASGVKVSVSCGSNPETTRVKNNRNTRITIKAVGSLYKLRSNEPITINRTLKSGGSITFQSGSAASHKTLTARPIYSDDVGSEEGAKVSTSVGQFRGRCPTQQRAIALGAFVPDAHRVENIDAYANLVGKQPAFVQNFAPWESPWPGVDTGFNEQWASAVDSRGAKPVFLWLPIQTADYGAPYQPDYQLSDIIRGDHDPYLRAWAQEARAYGKTVYVRLMPEANGSWAPYYPYNNGNAGPQQFIDAWRHVHDVVRAQEGAANVKFAWTMGVHYYKGDVRSNTLPLAELYPGNSYVDAVGLDSYVDSANWGTFEELFGPDYDELVTFSDRPVWISEVGLGEHPTDPTAKAQWTRTGLLSTVPSRFPRVSAVGYWHEDVQNHENYRIDTSQASLTAYREVAASQLYQGTLP